MIGALLSIPSLALSAAARERMHRRGFRDVTESNSIVLRILSAEGDRITELARKASMTKQSMGYLVEQVEVAGLVERADDPRDRRAVIIRRTPKGWSYNRAAAEEVTDIQREWSRLLGAAKMKQLKALLAELVAKLGYEYGGSYLDVATRGSGRPSRPRSGRAT